MIIRVFTALLFAAYFIEVGLVLVVTPWSSFWDHNYFSNMLPALGAILDTAAARGAVTGIGVVTAIAGVVELAGIFLRAGQTDEATGRPDAGMES
jgi:hypothetical protein